jgi:hypothetical protein
VIPANNCVFPHPEPTVEVNSWEGSASAKEKTLTMSKSAAQGPISRMRDTSKEAEKVEKVAHDVD